MERTLGEELWNRLKGLDPTEEAYHPLEVFLFLASRVWPLVEEDSRVSVRLLYPDTLEELSPDQAGMEGAFRHRKGSRVLWVWGRKTVGSKEVILSLEPPYEYFLALRFSEGVGLRLFLLLPETPMEAFLKGAQASLDRGLMSLYSMTTGALLYGGKEYEGALSRLREETPEALPRKGKGRKPS